MVHRPSRLGPVFMALVRLVLPMVVTFPLVRLDVDLTSQAGIIGALVFITIVALLVGAPDFMRREGYYLAYCASGLAYVLTPYHIEHIAFYEIAAQVAPVLFLALTIETRTFRAMDVDLEAFSVAQWFAPYPIVALLYVEFESLRVIAINDPTRRTFDVVVATLVAAGVTLLISATLGHVPSRETRPVHSEEPQI